MQAHLEMPRIADLFPPMRAELLRVLQSLSDADWDKPTLCTGWSVRDVALHILGDDVGLLSGLRDHDSQGKQIDNFADLVAFINSRNAVWVDATRRISRRLLLSLLDDLGAQWAEFAASVDPETPAGAIGWTGNLHDPMGLHLARELTEYWMHHQHICEAVGITSLKDARFLHAVLNTFVHCLPRTYQTADYPMDTLVKLLLIGEGGGEWYLIRELERWVLYASTDLPPTSIVTMDIDTAWRLFTKGLHPAQIQAQIHIEGNQDLGQIVWNAIAILA